MISARQNEVKNGAVNIIGVTQREQQRIISASRLLI
jgi:hypothetical protein